MYTYVNIVVIFWKTTQTIYNRYALGNVANLSNFSGFHKCNQSTFSAGFHIT